MTETVKFVVGRTARDVAADFLSAWQRADQGDIVAERVLSFESWEGLAAVMTGERYRLLRYLHGHPEPSVSALARALGR
jgi:predicted transcriptional regulator